LGIFEVLGKTGRCEEHCGVVAVGVVQGFPSFQLLKQLVIVDLSEKGL
jgi:hypothetical protein